MISKPTLTRVGDKKREGKDMNLNELIDLERGPRMALIQWLQRRYLLADPLNCAQRNQGMELQPEAKTTWMDFFGEKSDFLRILYYHAFLKKL